MRAVALGLTVLTGFCGLLYEVTWQKVLATLLGSHSEATAAVLALFLGGLALGYAVFGRLSAALVARARPRGGAPPLLLAYGLVEAGIGLWALLFPALFRGAQAVSLWGPLASSTHGFAFDVLLSTLLVAPPAVLMGGTIPILTQALARDLADATRLHSMVYSFNTLGAFTGALAAGYWIVPALGLEGAILAGAWLNLAAGVGFVALQRAARPAAPAAGIAPRRAGIRPPGFAAFCAVALLLGFAMMSVQTVLIRLGALSFGASEFTFAMVVAVFVLCIALGSLGVAALRRVPEGLLAANLWALVAVGVLLYIQLPDAPYWAHVLRMRFPQDPDAFIPYHLSAFLGALAAIGVPVALSGATLPLIFDHLRHHARDLGDTAGRLYSWNTLGSLLGALLGGYALLFWLDLHHVFRLALAALAVAAALATGRLPTPGLRWIAAALLPGLAVVALLPPWPPERLSSGLFRLRQEVPGSRDGPEAFFAAFDRGELRFYDDDPVASIALISRREGELAVVSNGKPDSAVPGDYPTTGLLALIPALLARRVERSFVVGYATGVTAGELARLDGAREVQVAEISPALVRTAPRFDFANGGASRSPALRIIPGDAYRSLLRSDGRFDLIVSEPSNPWVAGVEMLYSREFLEAARDRLAPGGVHAQWFHAYETDTETLGLVLRTYAAVFEHTSVWYLLGPDLLLIGMREPQTALDLARLAERARRPDFAAGLERCGIGGLPELLAHELLPMGVLRAAGLTGPLHTLLHPRLGHSAARAFFAGREAALPSTASPEAAALGASRSLARRYLARATRRERTRAHARIVRETCTHQGAACVAWLAEWRHQEADPAARERIVRSIRKHPIISQRTPLELIEALTRLYGAAADPEDPVAAAVEATERFARYYHHAVPFSRKALQQIWRRCFEAAPDRCLAVHAAKASRLQELGIAGVAPGDV